MNPALICHSGLFQNGGWVLKMPLFCVGLSKTHFLVQGSRKWLFYMGALINAILLYGGVQKRYSVVLGFKKCNLVVWGSLKCIFWYGGGLKF